MPNRSLKLESGRTVCLVNNLTKVGLVMVFVFYNIQESIMRISHVFGTSKIWIFDVHFCF